MKVSAELLGAVFVVTIHRPEVRNAVDRETADGLASAFREFESNEQARVAVLYGEGGSFSSGADLKSMAAGDSLHFSEFGDSPLGPIRMRLSKPVIAAISGYAVAGGMALALWCDLRVVEKSSTFGMFDRRYGVPMVGAVTVNLPRLIGLSRAMDLILTGRAVTSDEAFQIGLANRVVEDGTVREEAIALAQQIASFPWDCVISDRKALLDAMDMTNEQGQRNEFRLGMQIFEAGTAESGAGKFSAGDGRHGKF